jgi:RNA polymerase primary sigma factor
LERGLVVNAQATEDALASYNRRINRIPVLTAEEEQALFRRKETGDGAATRLLIESYLRFVVWVARRYARQGVPLLDLIQEGNLGLIRAIDKFDYRKGRLSTYAMWWIREAIELGVATASPQRIPMADRAWRDVQRVRRAQSDLFQRGNREPTTRELAAATGLTIDRVELLLEYDQRSSLLSLDTPITEDEDNTIGDMVEDGTSVEAEVLDRIQLAELNGVLSALDDRLRLVLDLRFGLSDLTPHSLPEIGRQLGVTAECARQLEERALKRLEKNAPELRAYLEAV